MATTTTTFSTTLSQQQPDLSRDIAGTRGSSSCSNASTVISSASNRSMALAASSSRSAASVTSTANNNNGSRLQHHQPRKPRSRQPPNWPEFYRNGYPVEVIVISDDEDEEDHSDAPTSSATHPPSPRDTDNNIEDDNNDEDSSDDEIICTGFYSSTNPSFTSPNSIPGLSYGSSSSTSSSASSSSSSSSYTSYSTAATTDSAVSSSSSSSSTTTLKRKHRSPSPSIRSGNSKSRKTQHYQQEQQLPALSRKALRSDRKRQRLLSEIDYCPPSRPIIKCNEVTIREVHEHGNNSSQYLTRDKDGYFDSHCPATIVNGRFSLTRVLGQGTFGKVYAAYDTIKQRHCAIKIIRAIQKYCEASKIELRVLSTVRNYDPDNRNRCIHVRESFMYRGHVCIITDLLSLSIYDFMKSNHFLPFPPSHVQSFTRQILTSVAFLHDLSLVHTDLKPENILLKSSTYVGRPHPGPSGTRPSSSSSGSSSSTPDDSQTSYMTLKDTSINLIDFGSAVFNDEYHNNIVSTRHYRAPEIILGIGWSFPCDVWSIGCIIVELCTGEALFQTHENFEHLALMEKILGRPIDRHILTLASRNPTGASFINPKTGRIHFPNKDTEKNSTKVVRETQSLSNILKSAAMPMMPTANTRYWQLLKDLLNKIFTYDPAKRITARQALCHPWLTYDLDDEDDDDYLD